MGTLQFYHYNPKKFWKNNKHSDKFFSFPKFPFRKTTVLFPEILSFEDSLDIGTQIRTKDTLSETLIRIRRVLKESAAVEEIFLVDASAAMLWATSNLDDTEIKIEQTT